ncbi:hypothetical protein KH990_04270 [Methanoculleus bourgensis]|jgi:hypothetical protein|uniref:hypothetical protein n=2 Tax=Methanoculleus bourgensis TaxID=83986 RepID=UPI0012E06E83|nr:hypothetical protein [Methanoculleus bourgensis]MBT0732584.1 hypothetical protein [Methanoculleus bourgensis]GLI45307.1 hypothetical protein MBOURGENBZM_00990 [Methanoculleus bourgensis]
MLRSRIRLFLTAVMLFVAATAVRYTALIWYPGYIGPAHLLSSILLGLAAVPVILLALSTRSVTARFAAANAGPGVVRLYRTMTIVIAAVSMFLISYYGHPPPLP